MADIVVDAVVVGAGPAGAAAATTLARSGASVLVIDRATFPRDKTCGDGLTTLALRELASLGLDPAAVPSWHPAHGAVIHAPGGREVRLPLPHGPGAYAAIARRIDLDLALVELARRAGAHLEEGAELLDASIVDDGVVLRVDRLGTIAARVAVGADGAWSPLRRALGLAEPGYRGEWHAFRQYLTGVGPAAAELHVWFEADLLPGYVWSFPLPDGGANVGFMAERGDRLDGGAMKRWWPQLLARPRIREVLGPAARPEAPHRAWPIPARIDRAPLGVGPVALVGDAAAATDVFTGEGIGQALLTGRLAAETIVALGPHRGGELAERYAAAVRHELVADHRMSARLSRVMASPGRADAALRVIDASPWTRAHVGRWLFEDSPRAIALTPRRWGRGVLHGDGAWAPSEVTGAGR